MLLWLLACGTTVGVDDGPSERADDSATRPRDSVEVIGETGDTDAGEVDEPTPDVVVDCTGGGDHTTITAAIAASPSGTKIGLMPCTYEEDVDFRGKTLDIYGLTTRSAVVLNGQGSGPVVTLARGESVGTRLAHVTITGGTGDYGAALYMESALLTLEDVRITGNERAAALIYTEGASLTMIDVDVEGNEFQRGGYLFYLDNGWLNAQRLEAACDEAQYGIVEHEAVLLLDSRVDCPDADVAMYVAGGEAHLRRTDVIGGEYGIYAEDDNDTRNERLWMFNTSVVGGTAVTANYMHVKARNAVFWGDREGLVLTRVHAESYVYASAFEGSRCAVRGDGADYAAGWNAVGTGEACNLDMSDTVTGDHGFADAPNDFTLTTGSPLIDAGDPDPDEDDDDGTRNDIGRYGGPEADGPR